MKKKSKIDHEARNKKDKLLREDPNKALIEENSATSKEQDAFHGKRRHSLVAPRTLEANLPEVSRALMHKHGVDQRAAVIAAALLHGVTFVAGTQPMSMRDSPARFPPSKMVDWRRQWHIDNWVRELGIEVPSGPEWDHALAIMSRWHPDLCSYALRKSTSTNVLLNLVFQVNLVLLHEEEALHVRRHELLTDNYDVRQRLMEKYGLQGVECALVAALLVQLWEKRYVRESKADDLLADWCSQRGLAFPDLYTQRSVEAGLSQWPREAVKLLLEEATNRGIDAPELANMARTITGLARKAFSELRR